MTSRLQIAFSMIALLCLAGCTTNSLLSPTAAVSGLKTRIVQDNLYPWTTLERLDIHAWRVTDQYVDVQVSEIHTRDDGADPQTHPTVAFLRVDRLTGQWEVEWPAPAEGWISYEAYRALLTGDAGSLPSVTRVPIRTASHLPGLSDKHFNAIADKPLEWEFEMSNDLSAWPVTQTTVTNGRQWLKLHQQGYFPGTTAAMHAEKIPMFSVGSLEILRHARPAQISHVRNLRLDEITLQDLPDSLCPDVGLAPGLGEERPQEARWHSESAEIVSAAREEMTIRHGHPNPDLGTTLRIAGWADLDGDGVEDVLLEQSNWYEGGSGVAYYHAGMTRPTSTSSLIEVVGVVVPGL